MNPSKGEKPLQHTGNDREHRHSSAAHKKRPASAADVSCGKHQAKSRSRMGAGVTWQCDSECVCEQDGACPAGRPAAAQQGLPAAVLRSAALCAEAPAVGELSSARPRSSAAYEHARCHAGAASSAARRSAFRRQHPGQAARWQRGRQGAAPVQTRQAHTRHAVPVQAADCQPNAARGL